MIGLTSLWIDGRPRLSPEINPRRALLVLSKIDEILSWKKSKEQERDVRFVELGEYLCELRAKQYWKLEKLTSFDGFLEKRFPESRRKAYYLMAIHENLTRIPKREDDKMFRTRGAIDIAPDPEKNGPAENNCHPRSPGGSRRRHPYVTRGS